MTWTRFSARTGLHDVAIEPPGERVLSHRDVERLLPGTRRQWGRDGLPGGQLQRLFAGPGLHDVAIEPPGVRVLSHHDVKQRHREHCIGRWLRRRFERTACGTRSAAVLISSMPGNDLARPFAGNCGWGPGSQVAMQPGPGSPARPPGAFLVADAGPPGGKRDGRPDDRRQRRCPDIGRGDRVPVPRRTLRRHDRANLAPL